MNTVVRLKWHAYRYFPYEKGLASREVRALLGAEPTVHKAGLIVKIPAIPECNLLERFTYFSEIQINGATRVIPTQARLETSAIAKPKFSGKRIESSNVSILRRQNTRYSAHGLHEYRGKYHPHIVRAIGNILGLHVGATILDPFCGSVETAYDAASYIRLVERRGGIDWSTAVPGKVNGINRVFLC
jgi:hypothetical protein